MTRRYFISEIDSKTSTEWKAGSRSGYATLEEASMAAEKLARRGGTFCVGLYEVLPDGDRDCIETCEYVSVY